jgi:signal transduction histidine kinase
MKNDTEVIVSVRDNGKGIPDEIAELRPDSIGIGIGGMRQRVKEFDGELRLRNTNPGTVVEVVIPINPSRLNQEEIPATAS